MLKKLLTWFYELPCRLGSHNWLVLEATNDGITENAKVKCSMCEHEQTITCILIQQP